MIEPIGLPVVLHQWCIVGFVVLWFAWRWNSAWKIAMSCTLSSCSVSYTHLTLPTIYTV